MFLLTNKNQSKAIDSDRNPLVNFSISSIFISWVAIPIVCMPLVYLIALGINGIDGFEEYISGDGNFLIIANFIGQVFLALYFFNELKRAKINYKHILGSLKQIDFKLPIMLTAAQYFFNGGINSFTLYGLSFIIPQYVENHINHQYATDIVGYIGFAISAMLFAPLIEEFFFRGMIFQKLALTRGIVKAMVISAIAFALVHFRYDLIPLFIFGILYVILYLKTKQLAVPILAHFFYNATVVAVRIYDHFFGDVDPSLPLTVADYQQQFLEHWQWNILYIALSAPYLCYFVYKNFPRSNDTDKLPYFANRKISGRST
ncbi:MAG: type II CAAX endopeptidase family protein [Cyanobacteria bacterium P01_G01_bin.19]